MVQKYKKVLSTFAHLQNKYTIHTKINYSEKNNNVKQQKTGSEGFTGWRLGCVVLAPFTFFLFFFFFCHMGTIYTQ